MSVAKVTEIIASSTKSFDDALKIGVARAHKTLTSLKSAWVKNQQIILDDEGQIREYRVQLKHIRSRRLIEKNSRRIVLLVSIRKRISLRRSMPQT